MTHPKKGRLKLEYASFRANNAGLEAHYRLDGLSLANCWYFHTCGGNRFRFRNKLRLSAFSLDFYTTLEPKLDGRQRKEKRGQIYGN